MTDCAETVSRVHHRLVIPTWSEGQVERHRDSGQSRPDLALWLSTAPPYQPRTSTCAAARSRGLGPILSRFCRDLRPSPGNSPNSGSHGLLCDHSHHITNIQTEQRYPDLETANTTPSGTGLFQIPRITGFRIALGHHRLGDLAERDRAQCQRVLSDRVDLYLHGHQHDAVTPA